MQRSNLLYLKHVKSTKRPTKYVLQLGSMTSSSKWGICVYIYMYNTVAISVVENEALNNGVWGFQILRQTRSKSLSITHFMPQKRIEHDWTSKSYFQTVVLQCTSILFELFPDCWYLLIFMWFLSFNCAFSILFSQSAKNHQMGLNLKSP